MAKPDNPEVNAFPVRPYSKIPELDAQRFLTVLSDILGAGAYYSIAEARSPALIALNKEYRDKGLVWSYGEAQLRKFLTRDLSPQEVNDLNLLCQWRYRSFSLEESEASVSRVKQTRRTFLDDVIANVSRPMLAFKYNLPIERLGIVLEKCVRQEALAVYVPIRRACWEKENQEYSEKFNEIRRRVPDNIPPYDPRRNEFIALNNAHDKRHKEIAGMAPTALDAQLDCVVSLHPNWATLKTYEITTDAAGEQHFNIWTAEITPKEKNELTALRARDEEERERIKAPAGSDIPGSLAPGSLPEDHAPGAKHAERARKSIVERGSVVKRP